jgi:hypothetical protein
MKIIGQILLITALGISGCGYLNKYEEPTGSGVAYISFSGKSDVGVYTVIYCSVNPPSDRGCYASAPTMAHINNGNPFSSDTSKLRGIKLKSGKPVAIRTVLAPSTVPMQKGCRIDAEFIPKAGEHYKLHVGYIKRKCSITLRGANGSKVKNVRLTDIDC